MSMTRLKIIDGDTADIVEGKVNHFIETYVYAVERIQVYPKYKDDEHTGGYYCYITYKEKYKDRADNTNGEKN